MFVGIRGGLQEKGSLGEKEKVWRNREALQEKRSLGRIERVCLKREGLEK